MGDARDMKQKMPREDMQSKMTKMMMMKHPCYLRRRLCRSLIRLAPLALGSG
jgi:hypothetical protein